MSELIISRNEFRSLAEALAASAEFTHCGTCAAGLKLHQHQGRALLLCSRRPAAHHGIRRPAPAAGQQQ